MPDLTQEDKTPFDKLYDALTAENARLREALASERAAREKANKDAANLRRLILAHRDDPAYRNAMIDAALSGRREGEA